jgi:CHAT domain-containing protein/tetratricopeptide (TPR) repeat protein
MRHGQGQWRPVVLAGLVLAAAAFAFAGVGHAQKDAAKEYEELLKGLFKGMDGAGGQQTPDNGRGSKDPLGGLLKALGGGASQQAQSKGSECTLYALIASVGSNDRSSDEQTLEKLLADLGPSLLGKDWETVIKLATRGLELEQAAGQWTLPVSREILRSMLLSNRGTAYQSLLRADRAVTLNHAIDDHEEALRQVLNAPQKEAACIRELKGVTHLNLAGSYAQRIRGERADNLENALDHQRAGLALLSSGDFPQPWAAGQNNLGIAYMLRIRGKRAGNIEEAIKAYERALTIWTREAFPAQWAVVRNNLGAAYLLRIAGDRASNVELAKEAFEDALTVRSLENPSGEKPAAQNPLNQLLQAESKPGVEDPLGDIRGMIAAYAKFADLVGRASDGPLVVLRPDGWAASQGGLGEAYRKRIRGNPADNRERAIDAYSKALTLWTREKFPLGWAEAKHNLGEAYASRILGDRAKNIEEAIAAYREALTVRAHQAFPRENLETARLLGQALNAKKDWRGALAAFDGALASFRLLFGQGLNEAEARDLLEKAGLLFTEAAYAAAEAGNAAQALALLEEGRARLLAVALRLDALQLRPAERRRLEDLRHQIREGEAAYEATQGEAKAAALASLGRWREELIQLVEASEARSKPGTSNDILSQAAAVIPQGGALAVPIVAEPGGKLVLITREGRSARLRAINLPQLTRMRLEEVLGTRDAGGWLGAYSINYLSSAEHARRQSEWLGAIERVGSNLGELLGQPLVEALSASGLPPGRGTPITVLPIGALGLLPIGLAQHPRTGRYLLEDYTVALAPSLAALASATARVAAKTAAPSVAVIVNPTGDLPFTVLEGTLVESRFAQGRALALREAAATSQAVLAALKGRDYWHFSSHGYFNWDDPRASGLWLTGKQRLTVGDLMGTSGLGPPRLVVLSACETGLYDIATTPNEFTGLPTAFLQLGAGGVLATQWPVNDLSMALLVARFYDLHRGQNLVPAVALREAQLWLRRATSRDLQEYVRVAIAEGKLTKDLAHSLEREIKAMPERQGTIRFLKALLGNAETRDREMRDKSPVAREAEAMFAHPYHWGGLVLTGL